MDHRKLRTHNSWLEHDIQVPHNFSKWSVCDYLQLARAYLGVRWKEEAGHTAVNTHCCSVDFLCDITSDHIVLLVEEKQTCFGFVMYYNFDNDHLTVVWLPVYTAVLTVRPAMKHTAVHCICLWLLMTLSKRAAVCCSSSCRFSNIEFCFSKNDGTFFSFYPISIHLWQLTQPGPFRSTYMTVGMFFCPKNSPENDPETHKLHTILSIDSV